MPCALQIFLASLNRATFGRHFFSKLLDMHFFSVQQRTAPKPEALSLLGFALQPFFWQPLPHFSVPVVTMVGVSVFLTVGFIVGV
jgi:hypothetical protein